MSHGRGPLAATALCVGVAVSSCAFQSASTPSLPIPQNVVQPTDQNIPPHPQGKQLSRADSDSDCVLSRGDLHLWCRWITRFY
jgi:hypothetical protein